VEGVRECVSADQAAIRAILDNQITAWNAGDAALHGRNLADDVIFATPTRLLQVLARRGQHGRSLHTITST
jgi:hypothetical protein